MAPQDGSPDFIVKYLLRFLLNNLAYPLQFSIKRTLICKRGITSEPFAIRTNSESYLSLEKMDEIPGGVIASNYYIKRHLFKLVVRVMISTLSSIMDTSMYSHGHIDVQYTIQFS